jgi:hypothetical protein
MDDPQGQRLGGAGTQLEPEVGLLGQLGLSGIHNDQSGAILQLIAHLAENLTFFIGGGKVAAPEKHQFCRMVEVGNRIEAAGVDAGDFPCRMTDVL